MKLIEKTITFKSKTDCATLCFTITKDKKVVIEAVNLVTKQSSTITGDLDLFKEELGKLLFD